jgi:hypothetical protein
VIDQRKRQVLSQRHAGRADTESDKKNFECESACKATKIGTPNPSRVQNVRCGGWTGAGIPALGGEERERERAKHDCGDARLGCRACR